MTLLPFRHLPLFLVFAGSGWMAMAQDSRGSIAGRVVDPQNANMPGVRITVANQDTGVASSGVTNEAGAFRFLFLIPGKYKMTAEMDGFRTYAQRDLEVRVADSLDMTLHLEVGSVTETVDVKGGTPLLDTGDSSVGDVIEKRALAELPQRGGNPLELERLSPGVANTTTLRIMKLSSPDGTSSVTVNGSGNNQTQYNIDGTNNTSNDRGKGYARVSFIPPSAAVQDFKLQSNPYDASFGHVMGSVINVGTKSGANDIHGEIYYWARNSAFDAANFFDNKSGQKKPVYQDHRYGAALGGPVVIPGAYNGRNKTFWFYSWEEDRYGQPSTQNQTSTVPTMAERTGDFSALLALGSQYQIYDPNSTRAIAGGRYQRTPFSGNILPPNLISPIAVKLAAIYPLQNQAGTTNGTNNYYFPDVRPQQYDSHLARFDHVFSPQHRVFARVTHFNYINAKNLLGIPATTESFQQRNQGLALDDVLILGPTLVLNIRYGVINAIFPEVRVTQGTDLSTLGFSRELTKLVDPSIATLPRVAVAGFATLSNWADGDGFASATTHTLVGDLTKQRGTHTIRFGGDTRLFRTFGNRYPGSISPDLSFANTYTKGQLDNSTAAPLGQELAALLLGIPGGSMTSGSTTNYATQNKYVGLYVQDDFKVTPKLTVNVGLRYELEFPVTERFNRLVGTFNASDNSPVASQAAAAYAKNPIPELPVAAFSAKGGLTFVGQNGLGRSPYRNSNNILPRAGLAYQLNSKTVFRAGYGIYFGTIGVDSFLPVQTGFSQVTPIQASLNNGVTYTSTLANPLPNGLLPAAGAAGGLSTNLGQAIQFFDPNQQAPYSQRWSFGLQRTLPSQLVLDVSYVGNRTTRLAVTRQINSTPAKYLSTSAVRDQATINFLTAQFPNPFSGLNSVYTTQISRANLLVPYPQFGAISVLESQGYSWYHSLQARIQRRMVNGLMVQTGFTYSKFMQATEFQNPSDPLPYRVISDLDRPLIFTASGVYELPYGVGRHFGGSAPKAVQAVLGGWQLDGTVIRQAGAPLGFGNALFTGNIKDIPLSRPTPDQWFNINAGFNRVTAQQLANNIQTFPIRFSGVRADGQATWSFSLIKNFKIGERITTQFRAEVYNTMNHPSFDTPNTSPTNAAIGSSTATVSEPRNWQFALKAKF